MYGKARLKLYERFNAFVGRSLTLDFGWSLGYVDALRDADLISNLEYAKLQTYAGHLYEGDALEEEYEMLAAVNISR